MSRRPAPVSGFPEWPPHVRAVELRWLDRARAVFESHGYCSVETPSVEPLDEHPGEGPVVGLLRDGDGDGGDGEDEGAVRLGLCADLTTSFARYAARHLPDLVLPFKHHQVQRVWRGEPPGEGRIRESTHCAIGVLDAGRLSPRFDAELPRVAHELLTGLDLPPWTIGVGNRKVVAGFCEGLGVEEPLTVLRAVGRLGGTGFDEVASSLRWSLTGEQLAGVLELVTLRDLGEVRSLGVESDLLDEGLDELASVLGELADLPRVVLDLSVVGRDHHTGTTYDARFDDPGRGGFCAGGRHDLVGSATGRDLPGVALSVDLTGALAAALDAGLPVTGPGTPTDVLVVLREGGRAEAEAVADRLRRRGFNVEVHHREDRLAAQLRHAARRGIPFAWFPPPAAGGAHEVRDLVTGERAAADPATWSRGR